MQRKIKKIKKRVLHLTCAHCGHKFTTNRFRKFCTTKCRLEVNSLRSAGRYEEMRQALYRQQGRLNN